MVKHNISHSPTLKTIQMVEKTMEKMDRGYFSVADLKKHLPKQVNHTTLITILEFLEKENKIYVGIKGMSWIGNPSPKLVEAVKRGYRYPEDFPKISEKGILR